MWKIFRFSRFSQLNLYDGLRLSIQLLGIIKVLENDWICVLLEYWEVFAKSEIFRIFDYHFYDADRLIEIKRAV